MSADEAPNVQELEEELRETQLAVAAHQASAELHADHAAPTERTYPSSYISKESDTFKQLSSLWQRFHAWVAREGASSHLVLAGSAAPAEKLFAIQDELAQGADDFSLPEDVLASFACHDGQCWSSTTGVLGRWYLLPAQTMFTEWRDQKEIMEAGLYSGQKYTDLRRAHPRHPRINTEWWFNPRWIPIACSRGENLGGDLICIDLDPIRRAHVGQVILYLTESPERIVLADSFAEWLERCVGDCERGVYRFDLTRRTYVAGRHPAESIASSSESEEKEAAPAATAAATPATSSDVGSSSMPTTASTTIGVEAFMHSALESRDFFIRNQTEALVYLTENDFGLLSTNGLSNDTLGMY